jgi:hypothetical protein
MSTIQLDYKTSVFSGRMVGIYGYDNTEWNVVTLQDKTGNLKKFYCTLAEYQSTLMHIFIEGSFYDFEFASSPVLKHPLFLAVTKQNELQI